MSVETVTEGGIEPYQSRTGSEASEYVWFWFNSLPVRFLASQFDERSESTSSRKNATVDEPGSTAGTASGTRQATVHGASISNEPIAEAAAVSLLYPREMYVIQSPISTMLIATIQLPPDAIGLEETLREVPDVEFEAERIAAHSTKWTMPCVWAASADFDSVDESLANDPSVAEIVEMYQFDDEKYYQLEWAQSVQNRIDSCLDKAASILDASVDAEGWRIQVRFVRRDQFDVFREYMQERDIPFQLTQLTEPGAPRQTYGGLTPGQRAALVAANERGYYRVPREISARELAAELDMSHQAVSELLRRGTENLITDTLVTRKEKT